jgi:hypothetical protein
LKIVVATKTNEMGNMVLTKRASGKKGLESRTKTLVELLINKAARRIRTRKVLGRKTRATARNPSMGSIHRRNLLPALIALCVEPRFGR